LKKKLVCFRYIDFDGCFDLEGCKSEKKYIVDPKWILDRLVNLSVPHREK